MSAKGRTAVKMAVAVHQKAARDARVQTRNVTMAALIVVAIQDAVTAALNVNSRNHYIM